MMNHPIWLRRFAKLTCFSTLFLIFVGSLVTSTGSGLSVPDWPLSYGMIFPPMVGGVFYEHGHRMVAATVGFFMLVLAIWLGISEKRNWLRNLGYLALGTVIAQGLLGGITVLLMLPKIVSISHAVLSQTFFILTIVIAYSLSNEAKISHPHTSSLGGISMALAGFVYLQLILGALMRHTGSGLAIPDFPTQAGSLLPHFDTETLTTINAWRFKMNLEPVSLQQVWIHFIHRLGALAVIASLGVLDVKFLKNKIDDKKILLTVLILNLLVLAQLTLGAFTIWSAKQPLITSFHVVSGAAILGMSTYLTLQTVGARHASPAGDPLGPHKNNQHV